MSQALFLIVLSIVGFLAFRSYSWIFKAIKLGKPSGVHAESKGERWKRVFLIAFGQKKMFKRPIPAILHGFIYVAFLFTQIELIEIIFDGITGKHRLFAKALGGFYTLIINTIEILSALALIATVVFLVRRLVIKTPRLHKPEMKGWPTKDGVLILIGELLLIFGIFTMNGADGVLQEMDSVHYPSTGPLVLSSMIFPEGWVASDLSFLAVVERLGWWLHALVVFGFIIYLPYSKHLHIFLAFFNVYFARLSSRGQMDHMPEIEHEIKSMLGMIEESADAEMGEIPDFGAKDVTDLYQRDILGAYTCTECGRCTSVCPANLTGKKLSPRKIMMDVRDRAEALTADNGSEGGDDASLFDFITKEEIHACTACQACVEACPVMINPLDIILQLRRYEILTEGGGPSEWVPMFTSMENSGVVWQMPNDRESWMTSE